MINRRISKEQVNTYSSVLLESVYESEGSDAALEVRDQLEFFNRELRGNIELSRALVKRSTYDAHQREALLRGVLKDFNPTLVEVLAVMVDRGEITLVSRVLDTYWNQLQDKLDMVIAVVDTYVPLDDHLREVVVQKIERDYGRKAIIRERVDKSMLGGIRIHANGKRIDASVIAKLENARNMLKKPKDGGEE